MSAHTPGPWKVSPDHIDGIQGEIFQIHWSDDGECIAECVHGEADARLIAAAPDLLAALELICSEYPKHRDGMDGPLPVGIKSARAAIAKATGAKS